MSVQRDLVVGDRVEVKFIHFAGEEWKPAQITYVDDYKIGVRFINESTKLMMLAWSEMNRAWRR